MKTRLHQCDFDQCAQAHRHECLYCLAEHPCIDDYCAQDHYKLCSGCQPVYDAIFAWLSAHTHSEIIEFHRQWLAFVKKTYCALSYRKRCTEMDRMRNLCEAFILENKTAFHFEKNLAGFISEREDTRAARHAVEELTRYHERKYGNS